MNDKEQKTVRTDVIIINIANVLCYVCVDG